MTNNSSFEQPAVEQKPVQNNWNSHEFGLKPKNIIETLAANFIKAWSYISGWDSNNSIWRAVRVDSDGNLKTTNGTQNNLAPAITTVNLTVASQSLLTENPLRRAFAIYNDAASTGGVVEAVILEYPNPLGTYKVYLPAGSFYVDDTWQGSILLSVQSADATQSVTLVEYY
jgi:hypothetical protein